MNRIISSGNTIIGPQPMRPPATGPVPPPVAEDFGLPEADLASREELLDLAYEATRDSWQLVGSRAHVEAICADYGAMALELARERERANHYINLHLAELQEATRLRELVIQQAGEAAQAQRMWNAYDRATLVLTGETCAQVLARMAREDAVDRAEMSALERIERAGRGARAYSKTGYVDLDDSHVVEVPA